MSDTGMVMERIEAQGLVQRTRSAADERQVRITLTDQGRALQARAEGIPACILARSGLDADALAALRDAVTTLRDQLRQGD